MQSIGKFSLQDQGGFAVKLQCVYWDEKGNKVHCDGTGSYPIAQCRSLDPGQASPPVPDGSPVPSTPSSCGVTITPVPSCSPIRVEMRLRLTMSLPELHSTISWA